MKKNSKKQCNFSADFFTKERPKAKPSNDKDYSKIEEIKWNKNILSGKTKVVATLPKDKKML